MQVRYCKARYMKCLESESVLRQPDTFMQKENTEAGRICFLQVKEIPLSLKDSGFFVHRKILFYKIK